MGLQGFDSRLTETFRTVSVGDQLPCLSCRSGAGGVGSRSECLSKRLARCLVGIPTHPYSGLHCYCPTAIGGAQSSLGRAPPGQALLRPWSSWFNFTATRYRGMSPLLNLSSFAYVGDRVAATRWPARSLQQSTKGRRRGDRPPWRGWPLTRLRPLTDR